jgi:diadenosine tetraphosphate (Ap4A) HIT family hydrolase
MRVYVPGFGLTENVDNYSGGRYNRSPQCSDSMSESSLCALCRAVNEGASEIRRVYDTHLASSEHFVALPSVGPIAVGHIMIVSRIHAPNLASMGHSAIEEYKSLVKSISSRDGFARLLEGEHGASANSTGGACITHCHVNLIPGFADRINDLIFDLPQLELNHDLNSLSPDAAPYILLRAANVVRLYRASNVPSQLIRRVLFAKIGRDDWDWAAFPNLNVVHETLELWGSRFG